jgi:hypothetical protein
MGRAATCAPPATKKTHGYFLFLLFLVSEKDFPPFLSNPTKKLLVNECFLANEQRD